jgi:hypothetical protein
MNRSDHMNIHASILQEADKIINGDRQQDYGSAEQSFGRIAELWTTLLKHKLSPVEKVTSVDVARLLLAMKLSRSITSFKRDNWVDAAGYASLAADLEARSQAPE